MFYNSFITLVSLYRILSMKDEPKKNIFFCQVRYYNTLFQCSLYGNPIFVLCRVNFMLYPCCEILHEWFIVSCLTLVLSTDSDFCYKLIPIKKGMRCVSLSFYYDCIPARRLWFNGNFEGFSFLFNNFERKIFFYT